MSDEFDFVTWDSMQRCFDIAITKCLEQKIPFGKYEGMILACIPFSYITDTLIDCRPCLVTVCAKYILRDADMMFLGLLDPNNSLLKNFKSVMREEQGMKMPGALWRSMKSEHFPIGYCPFT